jgi:hypothetical protein
MDIIEVIIITLHTTTHFEFIISLYKYILVKMTYVTNDY